MLLYTRLVPPKVPKKRSRAGCSHCKEKKKKCDEERPRCARCAERGLECVYEAVKPRQRRKRDSMASLASSMTAFSSPGGAATGQFPQSNRGNPHCAGAARRWSGDSPRSTNSSSGGSDRGADAADRLSQQDLYGWQGSNEAAVMDDEAYEAEDFSPLTFDAAAAAMPSPYSFTGDLPNLLSPSFARPPLPFNFPQPSEVDDADAPAMPASATSSALVSGQTHPHHRRGHGSDLAMIAPIPVSSPLLSFCPPLFSEISPSPQGRLLVDHFCNVLSHLIVFREDAGNPFQKLVLPLSMASEPVLNAVYALASAHLEHRGVATALLPPSGDDDAAAGSDAVDAGPREGQRSLYFHSRAIQGLARLIESRDAGRKARSRNELLAAIMLLVYYEVLVQKGRSNIVDGHLKGALTVMCSNLEPLDATGEFLERAFRFYDVIAALSFGTAPLSTAPAAGHFQPVAPRRGGPASSMGNVDTLLGMATTLWPIIHRLSGLSSLKRELDRAVRGDGHGTAPSASKAAVLRTEFETTADAIEIALQQWRPCLPPGFSPSPDDYYHDAEIEVAAAAAAATVPPPAAPVETPAAGAAAAAGEFGSQGARGGDLAHLHSIYHNAMAYRHSAFVYLYREVHELARSHAAVQRHARLALRHCAATCSHAGPMSALLWPLFVAACEATSAADRAVARHAFAAVERRQGMANIGRAWDIVQEVWRRADLLAAEEEGRRREGQRRGQRYDAGGAAAAAAATAAAALEREAALWTGMGCASRMRRASGALWRRVSEDMGVNIVFG